MKKLMLVAICAMAVMISCKNKGQTAPADSNDSLNAVIDSIIEENDTTPLPMFLIGNDSKYMQMLYWADVEEPKKGDDDDDYFEASHKRWELQEMFRRNAALYTNLIVGGDKITKVKFIDEVPTVISTPVGCCLLSRVPRTMSIRNLMLLLSSSWRRSMV